MKTSDEYGISWTVMPGDPARKLVLRLQATHCHWIVLPRLVLQTGILFGPVPNNLSEVEKIRMGDCLEYLRRSE